MTSEVTRDEIDRSLDELRTAENWMNNCDPDMIDAAIYNYNARLSTYESLLRRYKAMVE